MDNHSPPPERGSLSLVASESSRTKYSLQGADFQREREEPGGGSVGASKAIFMLFKNSKKSNMSQTNLPSYKYNFYLNYICQ